MALREGGTPSGVRISAFTNQLLHHNPFSLVTGQPQVAPITQVLVMNWSKIDLVLTASVFILVTF